MAEAAGFVLAAVPICVGVVEKYADVARLLQRFRKYSEEALYVSQAINIQRSIYRNTIRILLSSAVSEDKAQEMLSDPAHMLWSDDWVDQKISERLSDSREAFVDAASAVKIKLAMLESFGHECRSQVAQLEKGEPKTIKARKKGIRDKIKFAFAESEIELLITAVSRLTQEMLTLIQQTEVTKQQSSVIQPSMTTKRNIERYNTVKGAAEGLYQALSCACTVHTEHRACLSLQAVHNDPSQIQFTLAMSHCHPNPNTVPFADDSGFWLLVESVMSGTLQSSESTQVLREGSKPRKRQREKDTNSDLANLAVETSSKATRTKTTDLSVASEPPLSQQVTQEEHIDPLPNFCAKENFCAQLRRLSKQPRKDQATCVGYLELNRFSRHLVYLKSITHVVTSSIASPMVALTDLFKPEYQARLPCQSLPPQDRVRIAKQLAMAALQFQATSWLDKPWSSKEVSMLEARQDSTAGTNVEIDDLFLNASIRRSFEKSAQSVQSSSRSLVRNRLLFNLGVMMLELAFQKPLIELRQNQDIDRNEDLNTDYFTADRVRRQASARLGPRYAEAARKCIQCDFGSDSDLNETKLQESFYQNVICELEALEQTFRDFSLSI